MSYGRPQGAPQRDFAAARAWELEVGEWLGQFKVGNLDDPNRLDWWIPGPFVECKEKRQKLSVRWQERLPHVPEADLFVIDELSVRKAAAHFPHAYIVMRDVPGGNRVFVARSDELFCADRVRVDRVSDAGNRKGKWILPLSQFRQLQDPANELLGLILQDQTSLPWKASQCLSHLEVPTI